MKQALTQYLMIALMVVGAYMIGVYKTESEMLKKAAKQTPELQAQQNQPQQDVAPTVVTDEQMKALFEGKGNIVLGKKNAKLLIAEFSDASCPYCHVAAGKNPELNNKIGPQFKMVADGGSYVPAVPEIKKLVEEGKARFVWIYTPGRGNGELATKALYCANEKGKFWEAHDKLYTSEAYDLINDVVKNDVGNSKRLAEFMAPVLSVSEMENCLTSGKYDSRVVEDPKTVLSIGRFGTPTFIFHRTIFEGAQSFDSGMKQVVESVIK